ncbi:MAG TPA: glycosyltransferase family 39 protein [Candidatus Sulfotelmatobacter sp.]|nr:glycosyltransferase family 39 protein [Candidatus Sulfotelmatobacter sp.]
MAIIVQDKTLPTVQGRMQAELRLLFAFAIGMAVLHLLTNQRYGFHRDELQTLSDALHMDWGFVAYPPFTPSVEYVSMHLFGLSLVGLRLFAVLAQSLAIVVSGLMAKELGGTRFAQAAAALSVALSPLPLFEGTEFQYTTFDFLWWVLIAYFVIRLLKSEDPRWCLAIGATVGVGLMTKYTMCFYLAGIVGGMLFTRARRFLASGWFWGGAALALAICSPNLIWQARHGFISLHFLQFIHARDVGQGRADGFLLQQFWLCTNPFAAPLWIAGLFFYFRDARYRVLAWMYVIPLSLFTLGKARGYYLAAAYPMLIAMGATAGERWLSSLSRLWSRIVQGAFFTGLAACGLFFVAILIPLAPSGPLKNFALSMNGDLREEIGWQELVRTVAGIRDSLPPEQQAKVGVLVGNYGEQGAIEILGPAYHLPRPISGTNSAWLRGYPTPPPSPLIVVGLSHRYVERMFSSCRIVGRKGNSEGIKNEESENNPDIFLCDSPRLPWPEFWKQFQYFG